MVNARQVAVVSTIVVVVVTVLALVFTVGVGSSSGSGSTSDVDASKIPGNFRSKMRLLRGWNPSSYNATLIWKDSGKKVRFDLYEGNGNRVETIVYDYTAQKQTTWTIKNGFDPAINLTRSTYLSCRTQTLSGTSFEVVGSDIPADKYSFTTQATTLNGQPVDLVKMVFSSATPGQAPFRLDIYRVKGMTTPLRVDYVTGNATEDASAIFDTFELGVATDAMFANPDPSTGVACLETSSVGVILQNAENEKRIAELREARALQEKKKYELQMKFFGAWCGPGHGGFQDGCDSNPSGWSSAYKITAQDMYTPVTWRGVPNTPKWVQAFDACPPVNWGDAICRFHDLCGFVNSKDTKKLDQMGWGPGANWCGCDQAFVYRYGQQTDPFGDTDVINRGFDGTWLVQAFFDYIQSCWYFHQDYHKSVFAGISWCGWHPCLKYNDVNYRQTGDMDYGGANKDSRSSGTRAPLSQFVGCTRANALAGRCDGEKTPEFWSCDGVSCLGRRTATDGSCTTIDGGRC